jgi:Xaa-Pro dipeptidase
VNQTKINELKQWLVAHHSDLAYITDPGHIAYFSGFTSDPHERILALFIHAEKEPFLFAPALDAEGARQSSFTHDVVGYLDSEDPWAIIKKELVKRYGTVKSLATEKNALTVDRFDQMKAMFPTADFSKDLTTLVQRLQLIKTEDEIKNLVEAGSWADVAFETGFKAIKKDVSEAAIVAEIEYAMKKKGVKEMSFDTMVLAGAHAASPHGVPDATKVKENELVLFDLGVVWNGYCSDATRTVAFKQPTDFQKKIYEIVLEAQLTATAAIKPGITAAQLDKIARDVISGYGYGEYFNHRLGHGIGTTVHEFPSLVAGNDLVMEEGMCFSIEPGIYIPGKVGIRIEDCVHVTKNGSENFTNTPKELTIIE